MLWGALFGGIIAPMIALISYLIEIFPSVDEPMSFREFLIASLTLLPNNDLLTVASCGLAVGIPGAVWLKRLEPKSERVGGGCLLAVIAVLIATFVQLQFPTTGNIARANPYLLLPVLIAGGICGAIFPKSESASALPTPNP